MFTNKKSNGIMNLQNEDLKKLEELVQELEERLKDTEDEVTELEKRVEYLEETPDSFDVWHDKRL